MSSDGTDGAESVEKQENNSAEPKEQLTEMSGGSEENLETVNGLHTESLDANNDQTGSGDFVKKEAAESELQLARVSDGSEANVATGGDLNASDGHDELMQMVEELKFQNEYLKSQMSGLTNLHFGSNGHTHPKEAEVQVNGAERIVEELKEQVESLNRELLEEKQTRNAAEVALKHLREVYSEADASAQELTAKLAEAQQKMDQEIKERDEKNAELDLKLNRLHKRAKQRIQEVQKEKDDLQAQFNDINEKAERTSSQLSSLQQELERTRQNANEALKAIDAERQQLRSANNKLRDDIEELRRSLEPKENALEAMQQSLLEKEQMLQETRRLIQEAEDKRLASLSELSAKHKQEMENLEAHITDASTERGKAADTISSLRALVAEKESEIAEMEAASTGQAARLKAVIETFKGELGQLKSEHEKEKESWEAVSQSLKMKLETAESNSIRAEVELAKIKSQLESELYVQAQLMSQKDAELLAVREETRRVESEFASYKQRAHALLQRKDAEIAAARENEQLKAMEEALKEADEQIMLLSAERDKALQDLQDALAIHAKELASRDEALRDAEEQMKSLESSLNAALSSHQSEKEAWELNLKNVEEAWQMRCDALKAENEVSSSHVEEKELEDIKQQNKKLKDEHFSFRELADRMIEEKDKEISRLINDNENLRQMLESKPLAGDSYYNDSGFLKDDALNSNSSAEHQILILARQQAQREEELSQSQRHILALQEEIEELEHENRLHTQQVNKLKEELRNMDRKERREGVDLTYLKNIILKLLETGEVEALLPVVAMLLQFSPDEVQKCQQAYRASNLATTPASPANDGATSGLSLFSRFSFS